MKKGILTVAMFIAAMGVKAQYVDGVFTSRIKNGIGEEVTLQFKTDSVGVINSKAFSLFWNGGNIPKFIESHPGLDSLELFLQHELDVASVLAQCKLTNGTSYQPVNAPANMIYVNENDVNISFVFKAQNRVGNTLVGKIIGCSSDGGQRVERKVFIY